MAITNLYKIQNAIGRLSAIESDATDIVIALQGLQQVEREMTNAINVLIQSIQDVDNYRWIL